MLEEDLSAQLSLTFLSHLSCVLSSLLGHVQCCCYFCLLGDCAGNGKSHCWLSGFSYLCSASEAQSGM